MLLFFFGVCVCLCVCLFCLFGILQLSGGRLYQVGLQEFKTPSSNLLIVAEHYTHACVAGIIDYTHIYHTVHYMK